MSSRFEKPSRGSLTNSGSAKTSARNCFRVRALQGKVVLIDGETPANLMIDHGAGVSLEEAYEMKRMDSDFFNED